jgi:2-haloacid dehalogenase
MVQFIFDVGGVLLVHKNNGFMDEADFAFYEDVVMQNKSLRLAYDSGKDRDWYITMLKEKYPDYAHLHHKFVYDFYHILVPIQDMVDYAFELQAMGHGITIMSNWAYQDIPYLMRKFDWLPKFNGATWSGVEGMVKPLPNIYLHHAATYKLDPTECFFIDDTSDNIETAHSLGWRGYVFNRDIGNLRNRVDSWLRSRNN